MRTDIILYALAGSAIAAPFGATDRRGEMTSVNDAENLDSPGALTIGKIAAAKHLLSDPKTDSNLLAHPVSEAMKHAGPVRGHMPSKLGLGGPPGLGGFAAGPNVVEGGLKGAMGSLTPRAEHRIQPTIDPESDQPKLSERGFGHKLKAVAHGLKHSLKDTFKTAAHNAGIHTHHRREAEPQSPNYRHTG